MSHAVMFDLEERCLSSYQYTKDIRKFGLFNLFNLTTTHNVRNVSFTHHLGRLEHSPLVE